MQPLGRVSPKAAGLSGYATHVTVQPADVVGLRLGADSAGAAYMYPRDGRRFVAIPPVPLTTAGPDELFRKFDLTTLIVDEDRLPTDFRAGEIPGLYCWRAPGAGHPRIVYSKHPQRFALVYTSEELAGAVKPVGLLETPWPIEHARGRPFLWLGHGPPEGLGFRLRVTDARRVKLAFSVTPGPVRSEPQRRVVLNVDGQLAWQRTFNKRISARPTLALTPGVHDLQLYCTDSPDPELICAEDPRALLVSLGCIEIRPDDGPIQGQARRHPSSAAP
jgi:hypothetical protein